MDAKQLERIREAVQRQAELESNDTEVFNLPEYDHLDRQLAAEAPALLDYIDALKADMAKIRGLALQLTALSYSPAAIAGSEIYNLAAQHADEPEV